MNLCSCLFLGEPPHQRESFRGEGPLPDHRSSRLRTYRTGHRIRIDDKTNQVGQKMWRSEVVKTWRSGNRTRENNQSLDYSCVALFRIVVSIIGYTSLWIPMFFGMNINYNYVLWRIPGDSSEKFYPIRKLGSVLLLCIRIWPNVPRIHSKRPWIFT